MKELLDAKKNNLTLSNALKVGFNKVIGGLEKGAINMISVAIAIATAGIIVGAVASTGLSNNLIVIVEAISGGNIITLLLLTCLTLYYLRYGFANNCKLFSRCRFDGTSSCGSRKCFWLYFSTNCNSFICFLLWINGRCHTTCWFGILCKQQQFQGQIQSKQGYKLFGIV